MSDPNCLFCKIINKEIPAEIIYEDDLCLAFLDIRPVNPGHTLMIPKEHTRNIFDSSDKLLAHLLPVIKKISLAIKEFLPAEGINIHFNNEPAAGQVIFHTHAHIIPRYSSDSLRLWSGKDYALGEMTQIANLLKNHLS